MTLVQIAQRAGIRNDALSDLLSGAAPLQVASKLGISVGSLEDFLAGKVDSQIPRLLDCPIGSAEELRAALGSTYHGAACFILGVLMGMSRQPRDA